MTSSALAINRPDARIQRLATELCVALQSTPSEEVRAWGISAAKRLGTVPLRRAGALLQTAAGLGKTAVNEACLAWPELGAGQLRSHLRKRGKIALQTAGHRLRAATTTAVDFAALVPKLRTEPEQAAPVLLGAVAGFLIGAGGLDAEGGIPDLDLRLGGIGRHRSIFTHSIVAGAMAECAILAVLDLTRVVYSRLPDDHDPLWDSLARMAPRFAVALVRGADAGIAIHLAKDGAFGMTPYKDLPISVSMHGHRAILEINAAGEVLESTRVRELDNAPRPKRGIG
jgi:hypothetical protein